MAAVHPGPVANSPVDRVQHLFGNTMTSVIGNACGAITLITLTIQGRHATAVIVWGLLFALVWAMRLWLAWAFRRAVLDSDASARPWLRLWKTNALAAGALWGLAGWLFYGHGGTVYTLALLLTIYSYCIGSIPLLASERYVFLTYIALALLPTIARIATDPGPDSLDLAGAMTLIFAMTVLLSRNYRKTFEHIVELRARGEDLLLQLRHERDAAETARGVAETASRAKTQFFAAASHDLRQPLHALGLFAEALRGKSKDVEVVQLVNSINSSVDALEGLFSELLDITKIESGAIEPHPTHFALEDIFRRLRLNFEPLVFEKGLVLRCRGGQRAAFADPVLVERVLRNLVSNAIRYTEDGGVLVAARQRGDKLLLQVWDSGVGIHPRDQQRVFDEFVQIADGSVALPAHQRKGMGLGLAIVRRLATLMDARLSLQSRPGHGSVFALEIALGRAPRPEAKAAPRSASLNLTLAKRLIVVVEDDLAVKTGLEVILETWGASVIAFDSFAACQIWANAVEPSLIKPGLLIVDYRLEDGHTGIDAINVLRETFGKGLPTIMVTGSMLSVHEKLAQDHDFHLLVKPVVPNKLRAMIGFKLGMR
jgi:signal transduction histidine kinase